MKQNQVAYFTRMEIEEHLNKFTGIKVFLHEARQGCWVVLPKERTYLHSKLWRTLRAGNKMGIGNSPIDAAILFASATGAAGPRKIATKHRAQEWIINILSEGFAVPVQKIKLMAFKAGITWSTVDRASRKHGIVRKKCGFRGSWTWELPLLDKDC